MHLEGGLRAVIAGISLKMIANSNQPTLSSEDQQNNQRVDMKITDFNDHILWKFWDYLDLIDLANVSDANEQIAASTKTFFSLIYKNIRFDLRPDKDGLDLFYFDKYINFKSNSRGNTDLHNFFKHFGECLSHIRIIKPIRAYGCKNATTCISKLVGRYSSKTLLKLDLYGTTTVCKCFSDHAPFTGLQTLSISGIFGIYRERLAFDSINKRYPNLRSLEVYEINKIENVFLIMNQRLPYLEHFGIYFNPTFGFDEEYVRFLRSILSLNPQIKSLGLDGIDNLYDEFSQINFSNIRDIEIKRRLNFIPSFNLQNLTSLTAILPIDLQCRNIPVTLQKLELSWIEFNGELLNIAQHCRNLTSFRIDTCKGFDLKCVEEIAKNMIQLEEFTIITFDSEAMESIDLCFSVLVLFIKNCRRLRKAQYKRKLYSEDKIVIRDRQFTTSDSKNFLDKFKDILRKSLIFVERSHWSMMHEVRYIDLDKCRTWSSKNWLCIKLENQTRIE